MTKTKIRVVVLLPQKFSVCTTKNEGLRERYIASLTFHSLERKGKHMFQAWLLGNARFSNVQELAGEISQTYLKLTTAEVLEFV